MMNITQSIDITQIHNFFNSMKCVWMWVGGAYVDKISAIHYSKCEQMFVISLNCVIAHFYQMGWYLTLWWVLYWLTGCDIALCFLLQLSVLV